MPVRLLPSRQRLPWIATLLVVALSVAFGSPRSVASQPLPDVVVSRLAITPRAVRAGDPITATVTVRNAGSDATGPFLVGLFLATAGWGPLTDAVPLGTLAVDSLPRWASQQVSGSFTVPAVAPGAFSIIAAAGRAGTFAENNYSRRTTRFRVTIPNLYVSRLTLAPWNARVGDAVTAAVVVRNVGRVPADASVLRLYLETAPATPSGAATTAMLGTVAIDALKPGDSHALSLSFTVPTVPHGRAYYVWAQVDPDGSRRAARFEVAVSVPDVTVDDLSLTPSVVQPGQITTASVRIMNRGHARSRPTTADVFLATSESAQLQEGTAIHTLAVGSLSPGASVDLPVPLRVPLVDPGAYYAIAQVDSSTAAGGGTTTLLTSASTVSFSAMSAATTSSEPIQPRRSVKLRVSLPDLTVSSLSLTPNHGRPGTRVTVTLTAQNTGSASAPVASVALHLAPMPDSALPDTTILGTVAVPPLAPGGSTRLTTTLTVPVTDAGDYQLLGVIDPAEAVAESIETNNRRNATLVVDSPGAGQEWAPNPYGILVSGMDHNTPRSEIAIVMQKAKEGGARWVRTDFWWYSAEWFRGQWSWSYFDNVVEEASARGMEVIPILWGTPAWAATDGVVSYGVPDLSAWETFVRQTVTRYRDRITVWEIWNEPDTTFYFKGTPTQYAAILARAATAIRAVAPHAQVWLGGLAQGGIYAVPDFLERILAAGAGANFDVHNVHTNFQTMAGMTAQLARNQALVPDKPLVVTEASYASNPNYQWLPGYTGGEEGQARYLVDAYRTMLGAGVKVAVWANIGDYQGNHEYASSGLVRINLSEKPAFWAFQDLAESAP